MPKLWPRKNRVQAENAEDERKHILNSDSNFYIREAYKTLRTNVCFSLPKQECHVFGVTSAEEHAGKSITALNLAITLGENGARVLLIDCDLRRPNIARLLNLKANPGLSNFLVGQTPEQDVVRNTDYPGLSVLLSGDIPPNPSELLGSSYMVEVLEQFKQRYDYVVLDMTPVNVVADASILAPKIDGVVLVARQGQSRKDSFRSAIEQIEFVDAKILGVVLNDASTDSSGRYGNSKKYGYGYGYGYAASAGGRNTTRTGNRDGEK